MKSVLYLALAAVTPALLAGCSTAASGPAPAPVGAGPETAPLAARDAAVAAFEEGKLAFHELNFEAARTLFEQAVRLDPANTEFGTWLDRTNLELSQHVPDYGRALPDSVIDELRTKSLTELVECRFEIDGLMRQFSRRLAAGDRPGAALALSSAVRQAREVRRLAAVATKGRAQSQWHARGTQEFAEGNVLTAAFCMEFSAADPGTEVEIVPALQAEVRLRQEEEIRRVAFEIPSTPVACESRQPAQVVERPGLHPRAPRGPAPLEAAALHEMRSQILFVARSRMFTMDREAVLSDLDRFESLGGLAEETAGIRDALHLLETWHPFVAETGSSVSTLAACALIIRLQRDAILCEARGDFLAASEKHDSIALALCRLPFRPLLDALGREARSSAARCRSLAGLPELEPATVKNW